MAKKTESSLVKYGDYSVEEAEEDAKEMEDARSGGTFWKLKPGKARMRFLPPLPGRKWKRVQYQHFVDVPGVGRVMFTCPRMEAKQPCRTCAQEQKFLASSNAADNRRARKLRARRRCMANVLDRSRPEDGPRVLAFGSMIENQLVDLRKDEDMGGNFIHPVEGFDILIIRTGLGPNDTEYKVIPADKGKACALSDDVKQANEWIGAQHNLDKYVKVYSEADIDKLLRGEKPGEDGDGDDEDSAPVPRKSKSIDEDAKFDEEEDDA